MILLNYSKLNDNYYEGWFILYFIIEIHLKLIFLCLYKTLNSEYLINIINSLQEELFWLNLDFISVFFDDIILGVNGI